MPKRSSNDPIIAAKNVLDQIIAKHDPKGAAEEAEAKATATGKNPAAVALGRLGGLKGGKARADKLSERRRKQIAKKAAKARWSKKTPS